MFCFTGHSKSNSKSNLCYQPGEYVGMSDSQERKNDNFLENITCATISFKNWNSNSNSKLRI
jgi:hypothetical protein